MIIVANVLLVLVELTVMSFLLYPLKYYQSKLLSFVTVSFLAFLTAHFMPYPKAFYIVLSVWLMLSAISIWRLKKSGNLSEWFDPSVEVVFFLAFGYFLILRWLNPDIFGAEKFMDAAFISSILASPDLPPLDPFLAGYRLNCYYYFGHVLGASVTLMSFTSIQYGYNIAMAVIAAYSSSTLYGFLKDIGMKKSWIGVVFTLFTGDFYGFYELLKDAFTAHRISWLYYWNATRVIPGTINEFPYFSFLHADFHAHVVAIPLFILSISLLYSMFCSKSGDKSKFHEKLMLLLSLVLMSAVLYLTNSWDSPVFLLCLTILFILNLKKLDVLTFLSLPLCVASAYLASTTIHSASAVVHLVKVHTPVVPFLLYFLVPVTFAYFWVFSSLVSSGINGQTLKHILISTALSLILSFFLILKGVQISVVILPLLFASLLLLKRRPLLASLVFTACFFTMLPEFVAIDCRMNTVFKFYEVSWILFSIPGSFVFDKISLRSLKKLNQKSGLFTAIVLGLFLTTFAYPCVATPQKCSPMRFTLNGMEFTKYFGEYRALLWAQKHVRGVLMSASYNCYTYGGRFPAFTGNPVVVGWACHEVQWRGKAKMLGSRMFDVQMFYRNPAKYWHVLKKYGVNYVILGYEERKEFGTNREKFKPLVGKILKVVYSDRNVVIYRVLLQGSATGNH